MESYHVKLLGTGSKDSFTSHSKVCHNFPYHHKFMSDFLFPLFYLSIIRKEQGQAGVTRQMLSSSSSENLKEKGSTRKRSVVA